jgi:hypothetical protein
MTPENAASAVTQPTGLTPKNAATLRAWRRALSRPAEPCRKAAADPEAIRMDREKAAGGRAPVGSNKH